ncbi:MAG TPA: SDR family NAD(P)-dependent oxidoreductase, partial [Cryomorphaceae bacterium]|nr:SDR family NAD(P)-dependent oxidoreductase [Cryomorphaceae bacterium]
MSKIILTGGAGYIGSHIAVSLVEHGFHPVILDNFSTSDKKVIEALKTLTKNRLSAFETDCRDWKAVLKIMRSQGEITGVIHLAAYKAVGESVEEPLKYYDNNIGSLLGIASAMEMAQIKNFVFSSSCTVYGTPEEQPVFESTPWEKAFS